MKPAIPKMILSLGMAIPLLGCSLNMKEPAAVVDISPIVKVEKATTVLSIPAFPGAEGFGATTIGGRGGRVIEVTNLNDSGPGSLRAALVASGPRIVVFTIGGTIELDSSIEIINPYLTIAGQTVPGDGITLRNSPKNAHTPLKIETHDVVVRNIRSRPGSNTTETGTLDAITISSKSGNMYNVVVDHCSFSWATDEVANIYYAAHDVTVQWCIISEALDCATHVESGELQCHSMGMLIGSAGSTNISIHHNLFAHNRHRNPKIKTSGLVDVVNNVVYNSGFDKGWQSPTYVVGEYTIVPVNYIGNYFKPGVNTGSADWFINTKGDVKIYLERNFAPKEVIMPEKQDRVVYERHLAPTVTTTSAQEAFDLVLAHAGASLGLNCDGNVFQRRDTVDERIINEVGQGTGRIINDPSEVGGWPVIAAGTPCPDTDHDGMPDMWENLNGFNPNDPSDGPADADGDGYTNVEEYLNGLAQ